MQYPSHKIPALFTAPIFDSKKRRRQRRDSASVGIQPDRRPM